MLPGFLRWLCGVPLVVLMLMDVFGVFASAGAAGVVSLVQDDSCGVDVQEPLRCRSTITLPTPGQTPPTRVTHAGV